MRVVGCRIAQRDERVVSVLIVGQLSRRVGLQVCRGFRVETLIESVPDHQQSTSQIQRNIIAGQLLKKD